MDPPPPPPETTASSFPTGLAIFVATQLLFVASMLALKLILPIVNPTIITYPWPLSVEKPDEGEAETMRRRRDKEKVVVIAGSYNPPHRGHLAMIRYLSKRYGQVIVVIGMNPDKSYEVKPYQRADLLRRMVSMSNEGDDDHDGDDKKGSGDGKKVASKSEVDNVRVEVVEGYIWRTVKKMGATAFFRGIRSWEKDGDDERRLQILNTWGPLVLGPLWWPLPTLFLEGDPRYNHVSSTLIREICSSTAGGDTAEAAASRCREDLKKLVPSCIVDDVAKLYGGGGGGNANAKAATANATTKKSN